MKLLGKYMGSLKKLNTEIPYDPPYLLALKSKESESAQHRDTMLFGLCTFTATTSLDQPRFTSGSPWRRKMLHMSVTEFI